MSSFGMFLVQWLVAAVALLLTAAIMPGFRMKGLLAAMIGVAVIGLANAFIRPVLLFLSLPINILTLGLFTFVVNGAVLKIAAAIVPGFEIEGWWAAIFGAIVLAIINMVFGWILFSNNMAMTV